MRGLGQVIGVGTLGALFQVTLARELRARLTGRKAGELVQRILHDLSAGKALPSPQREQVIQSFVVAVSTPLSRIQRRG